MDTVVWRDGKVRLIDQTRLPGELVLLDIDDLEVLAEAIEVLRVRGAPAIGVTAAYGIALAARLSPARGLPALLADLRAARDRLARTRPTAVNLFWALDRMMHLAETADGTPDALRAKLLAEAEAVRAEDLASCRAIGRYGAELLPGGARILTHCNAGALATAGYGTALGVVRAAAGQGKVAMVYADETRPLLQGARLTAWEMVAEGIPVTLLTDNMAGHVMRQGLITCVVTGADRIAANGDAANKIGTYGVAVLAHHHGIPMYIAAPRSTFDFSLPDGAHIPIEERRPDEVRGFGGVATAPAGASVYNPAFDVTPHELITAIITDRGVFGPPYVESLQALARDEPGPGE
ncbi:MAG: S-methyl-5-thioribose-1-phosphate isomerase [Armatimonadetes bacterium]|nr:S-methyl-5-thioribose-1-phosphate isomerase [Armatimonadota bacterium]